MCRLLSKIIRGDSLGLFLIDGAHISQAQLDSWLLTKADERSLSELAGMRDGKAVTKGSFSRTLYQARQNARRAICTILLLEYLDLLSPDVLVQIGEIGKTLGILRTTDGGRDRLGDAKIAIEQAIDSIV